MYVAFVGQLLEQFKTRFVDLCANNQACALLAIPCTVTVNSVTIHMELTELQCNTLLKIKFTEQQYVKADQFSKLMHHA